MLVILPRPKNSRHIYGFDLDSLTSVWIVYKDERNRVYRIIPASSSKILPLTNDFKYLDPHKVKFVKKPLSMKWVSAFTIKQRLLKSLQPFMIEEVQPRKPSSIFEAVSSAIIDFIHTMSLHTVTCTAAVVSPRISGLRDSTSMDHWCYSYELLEVGRGSYP